MGRVFLDTNFYIDITKRAREKWESLRGNLLFISPLSAHILFYTRKLKVPDQEVNKLQEQFGIVPLTKYILNKALEGPTIDLEDNIQLHSAAEAECDLFLTEDKKLLDLKFFGKTQVVNSISQ
jgi:predicted nucleic acid-binding protein